MDGRVSGTVASGGGAGGSGIYYLGTGTSFEIGGLLPNIDFTKLTIDSFIAGCLSAPKTTTGSGNSADGGACAFGWSLVKTYNVNTGVLTVTGNTQEIRDMHGGGSSNYSATQNAVVSVWLVMGDIQAIGG